MSLHLDTFMLTAMTISFVGYVVCVLLGLYVVLDLRRSLAKSERTATSPEALPGVTIMKPCAGADDDLEGCLESFFALQYPRMQIIFGLREASDDAHAVIERVRARHPEIDSHVVFSGNGRHPSPKVNNLEAMEPFVRYDIVWLSDSNTRVHPGTLTDMVRLLLEPRVGVVVSPIVGDEEITFGSAVENCHLNNFAAMVTFAAYPLFRQAAAPGKSVLLRREHLQAIGSWNELGKYSGEDIVLLTRIRALGLRIALGRRAVVNVSQRTTLQRFLARHLRWAQIRWRVVTPSTALEPLLSPLFTATVYALTMPSERSLAVLALCFCVQTVGDLLTVRVQRGHGVLARNLPVLWLRPFFGTWLWVQSLFVWRFEWRGNTFWMGPNSEILAEHPLRTRLRAIFSDGASKLQ